ncbi:WD domain, G-beta repeat protein [Dictyocaulus viviparus]|uniref:WD domain, G-beta repeat protein n=1 Tax=Dictyocaulus viviparus TaxID=29172 RepID=A0A0D8XZ83_DICVI|nr:WD domain, G-beta repeat protein [Dictyocaulus viviparus]
MLCLSGGRDRAIKLWNIDDLQRCSDSSPSIRPCADVQNAHEGWIWCLDQSVASPDHFLSCSWDCTVKLWQLTPNEIVVFIMDTKNSLCPVLSYVHHKGAVLTVAMQDNIVYSCGEDRRIVMVDIRNSSKPVSGVWSMDYVRSACLRNNQLICGTHLGLISTLDPETLDVCSRFQVSSGVRQVVHSGGAILEISRDRIFKKHS